MSFLITRRPEKLFTSTTKFSRWTGISNPYNFEFTRRDYGIYNTAIRNAYSTTLPTMWTDGDPAAVPLFVQAGDSIYVNSGVYNGVYTVHSVNGQYITIDTPFIGNGGSGHVNLIEVLTNYKAYVKIYDAVTDQLIDEMFPKPDNSGLLVQDVSGLLRSLVNTDFDAGQSDINVPNKGISGSFKIGYGATYTYVFDGGQFDVTIPEFIDTNIYYWTSSAKQIDGDTALGIDGIGQNLKEYVPKNIAGNYAKFLTMFEAPTYFEGFPFFLSFLYDDADFEDNYLVRHQQDLNVNGVNVGAETEDNTLVTGKGYNNQMKVRTPNAGTNQFEVWLEVGDEISDFGFISGNVFIFNGVSNYAQAYTTG